MSASPPSIPTDRECLEAWRRHPGAESLRFVVERYVAFVYASAYRRTGRADHANEVTRAVFLVLARCARRLRKKTVLAGWLFQITALACRKLVGKPKRRGWWWFWRRPSSAAPPDAPLWAKVAPELDGALDAGAVSVELVETLAQVGPFGSGNPEPRFAIAAFRVLRQSASSEPAPVARRRRHSLRPPPPRPRRRRKAMPERTHP